MTNLSNVVRPGDEGFGKALCGLADVQAVVEGPEIKGVTLRPAPGTEKRNTPLLRAFR